MLSEKEIEWYLHLLDPTELMLKDCYEEKLSYQQMSEDKKRQYVDQYLQNFTDHAKEEKMKRITTMPSYHRMKELFDESSGNVTEQQKNFYLKRKHLTHREYALAQGQNLQIIRHCRYSPSTFHDHEFIELVYVLSGQCHQDFQMKTSVAKLDLHQGELVIIPPGMKHRISVFDDSVVLNIVINRDTFQNVFLQDLPEGNLLYRFFHTIIFSAQETSYIVFDEDEAVRQDVLRLAAVYIEEELYYEKICEHLLSILFLHLMENKKEPHLSACLSKEMTRVAPMILYIQEHYKDGSLEQMAEDFHYSKANVNRIFKKYTGTTVLQYMRDIRLEQSVRLLRETVKSVDEIAEEVGYQDTSYYIEQFKIKYSKTPLQYRKDLWGRETE